MSFFFRNSDPASLTEATSTLIHRPGPDVIGLREVIDELTGLTVIALPMTMVREIVPARAMMTAAYVLAGPGRIYCGESTRIGRRIDRAQSCGARKVSHCCGSPPSNPCLNQCTRWALVPCVNVSATPFVLNPSPARPRLRPRFPSPACRRTSSPSSDSCRIRKDARPS